MDNAGIDKVFHNDYIMAHILRMLDLKQQYDLQKVCERLRFLVTTCVWRRCCKEIQMNRNQVGRLTDDEFFELLQLNADNIRKLTIDAVNGAALQMYFPVCYENLLELRIKWFRLDDNVFSSIVSNCPHLRLLDYNEDRDENRQPERELQKFEMLWALTNLRVLIWRNLVKSTSYADLCSLATKVPLECLEMYNVKISTAGWESVSNSLVLADMQILKIDEYTPSRHYSNLECLEFIKKCPNLQELDFNLPEMQFNYRLFDKFKHLERIKLKDCNLQQPIWLIMRHTKLKCLEIVFGLNINDNFKIKEDVQRICGSLQKLELLQKYRLESSDFGSIIFQSPSTNFENLRELVFKNQDVLDDIMWTISLKCQQLEALHLDNCKISGKYINHLTNIQRLTIINNDVSMSWTNLYSILKELKSLQYLELDCFLLTRDDLSVAPYKQHLANSLETLKIYRTEEATNFWEYILENCEDSFQKVHSLHFRLFEVGAYFDYSFFAELPQLQTLQIEGKAFIAEDMIPTVKHLIFVDCIDMKWSNIVEILKCTKVEIFEIFYDFDLDFDFDDSMESLENDMNILKYIRRITIPYAIFEGSCRFWQRCLEACPQFQLCCMGHSSQSNVLESLFENTNAKMRITGIHANNGLNGIKTCCAQHISTSKIPVYLLDAENKMLWNPKYVDKGCVIIIEV